MNIFGIDVSAEIGAMATSVAAIVGGAVGIGQYLKSERWKRAEFAISQVRVLSEDPTLAFCCRAIDWGVGPLIVPEKYRALFSPGTTTVQHNWLLMAKALRPKLHEDWSIQATQAQFLLYRYAFDDFFSYLDALATYRHLGVVRTEDLDLLDPYLRQLKQPVYWRRELPD